MAPLLAMEPEEDSDLRRLMSWDKVVALREELAQATGVGQGLLAPSHWRNAGERPETLRDALPVLTSWAELPIDALARSDAELRSCEVIRRRLWSSELTPGARVALSDELSVVNPEACLQQLAARASLARTIMLASELCGSFAAYRPPAPLRIALRSLLNQGKRLDHGGWEPLPHREWEAHGPLEETAAHNARGHPRISGKERLCT
ncbi:hypothetical protein [Paratractidigestivibacter sp.]|uniref:hypothetical protein n=1 Tax=Paratractidigestivibacter sp. TaxID=2847316 RepID=UPI002AC8CE42|nr:hypothetical protein [Paratractidigestivibacter sp.]